MKTSTKHLATRAPEQALPSSALLPVSLPASGTPNRRPGSTLPLPARPLRLVVDHDGVTAPDHSARPPARRAVATVPPEGKAPKAAKAKLATRVGAAIDGAIASVVSKVRKAKTPANPLVCLGPGGEFATAYVGERDGSLTATNPEEFVGLAGTDRASRDPSSGAAVRCDTESERAMLALAAIGAATAARLKAQMAAVYRLASLCRSAMSSVSALSPMHRGELPAAKRRKSSKKPAVSTAGLFGPAVPASPSPVVAAVSQPVRSPARTPAQTPARRPASRAASKSASARPNTRSKSRKAGADRSKGVPQSSFSTAATQPMLPLAQEVAA